MSTGRNRLEELLTPGAGAVDDHEAAALDADRPSPGHGESAVGGVRRP